jgi:hypothetical protein
MEDIMRDYVSVVRDKFRKEISYQALNYDLDTEEITYNIELILTFLNELDKLDDDTFIEVFYNPMGLYQGVVIEESDKDE